MVLNNALARVVAFTGQIALGWFLLPTEFGTYAMAVSITTVVGALRNGGSAQLLIQRGSEYETLVSLFLKYSLSLNVLAMIVVFGLAPFAPRLFGPPELTLLIVCIGLSFPLGTAATIFRTKLTIDNRFQALAMLNTTSTILLQVTTVGLAYLGYGVFSFVTPLIIQVVYETLAGRVLVGKVPGLNKRFEWRQAASLLRETRWIMLAGAMLALATTGDYLAVGLLTDELTVGLYFFGFQLVVAVGVLFSSGIEAVFPSVLAQLNLNRPRQAVAFLKSLRVITLASMPACVVVIIVGPTVIHWLWHGKWDAVSSSVQVLSACIPAWLIVNTGRTLIEARGSWRIRFWMMGAYGIGGMASAGVGASIGGLHDIALAVSAFYVLYAISFLAIAPKLLSLSARGIGEAVYGPMFFTILCALLSMQLARLAIDGDSGHELLFALTMFLTIFGVGNALIFRNVWSEMIRAISARSS
jgi:O-antigen/teichoic acid export membrane protein